MGFGGGGGEWDFDYSGDDSYESEVGVAILGSVSDSTTGGDVPTSGGAAGFGAEGNECCDVSGDARTIRESSRGLG